MMQTVYITGASAGLGRAIAAACVARGMQVGLIARDGAALQRLGEELGPRAAWVAADVASHTQVGQAFAALEQQIGAPDILVCNAMATIFSRFDDIAPQEFARALEVTCLGSVYCMQQALRRMRSRGHGHIIQIGSALSYRAIPLQAPYCAAKFAVRGAFDALRCELMHDATPVQLTLVQMPAINTPQFDWSRRRVAQHPQPLPPIHAPQACAEAVLWTIAHPHMREVWVGLPTIAAIVAQSLVPGFMDRYMARKAYEGQFERPAETAYAEGNLVQPIAIHATQGRFASVQRHSVFWIGISEMRERVVCGGLALLALWAVLAW